MPLPEIQYLIRILRGQETPTFAKIFGAITAIVIYLTAGGDPAPTTQSMFVAETADETLLKELERLEAVGNGQVTTQAAIPTALLIQLLTGFLQKWLVSKLFSDA
jgi:hypothetical protein